MKVQVLDFASKETAKLICLQNKQNSQPLDTFWSSNALACTLYISIVADQQTSLMYHT